ncbi:MAG: hypothetical protein WAN65_15025, partial [Candidatus Sulfotelmatobacter sp.]
SIIGSAGGLIVGVAGTYFAFYIRGALIRREQIAKSLAAFYASAATVYYAYRDHQKTELSDEERVTFYKLFDGHYHEFLTASTMLASLVPPGLREEVLKVEDVWDEIGREGFEVVGQDMVRSAGQRSVQDSRFDCV